MPYAFFGEEIRRPRFDVREPFSGTPRKRPANKQEQKMRYIVINVDDGCVHHVADTRRACELELEDSAEEGTEYEILEVARTIKCRVAPRTLVFDE